MRKLNKKGFVIKTLRRASLRWPARNEALKLARIERGLYKCAMCRNTFKKQNVSVDHKNPVVDTKKGFTTIDEFVDRLLVEVDELQVLCRTCHDAKSLTENNVRDSYKSKRKKKRR